MSEGRPVGFREDPRKVVRMAKTMAEVLAEHQFMHHSFNGVTQKRYLTCSCGESPLAGDHPTHLAAALSAAGYGLVREIEDQLRATSRVLEYREAELLKLKGPCSNKKCTLHYAHSGPCNEATQ